ncbi:MAG: protein translocase subunit SecD, partial [Alphaproteobacteria bacterium]|nr:protein translocase subunit SecD [Alphaproteobacteria bacterium]
MKSISTWKIALTFLLIIIATFYVIPNFTEKKYNWLPGDKVILGLDLRGGSHLLLDVDFESYLDGVGQSIADSLKKYLRQEKVGYKTLVIDKANINFEIKSVDDFTEVKKIVKKIDPNL